MLLIDCYNLLHTAMPPALAGLDEDRLCRLLARGPARSRGRDHAVVVCDGVPKPGVPSESPVAGIELVYSGAGRTADDVIIERIDADSAPRRLVVVSTDHRIRRAARRRARAVTSDQFVGRLVELLGARGAASGPPPRGSDKPAVDRLSESDVQAWLEAFDVEAGEERSDLPWGYDE